jgi:hypothetical protein
VVLHREEDFQPGDFIVTPVLDGFMVGKVLPPRDSGAWWTIVRIVPTQQHAVRLAITLALALNTRVWFNEAPGRFSAIERDPETGTHSR